MALYCDGLDRGNNMEVELLAKNSDRAFKNKQKA